MTGVPVNGAAFHRELKEGCLKWNYRPTIGLESMKEKKAPKGHPLSEGAYQQMWSYYLYLINHHREYKELRTFLYPGWVIHILESAKKVLALDSSLVEIDLEKEPIMFFGNLYGSFADLIPHQVTVVESADEIKARIDHWPLRGRTVYLGNIINRGFQNLETLLFVLLQKCIWPQRVVVLRGQEETRTFSQHAEFMDELIERWRPAPNGSFTACEAHSSHTLNTAVDKDRHLRDWTTTTHGFPDASLNIYVLANEVFDLLPLAALYGKKETDRMRVLCVSSGMSPSLKSLADIRNIKRPVTDPLKHRLSFDLLTAHPCHNLTGTSFNFRLGYGTHFGENVLDGVLKRLKITAVLRTNQTFSIGLLPFPSVAAPKLITLNSTHRMYRLDENDPGNPNLSVVLCWDEVDKSDGSKGYQYTRRIAGEMPELINEKKYDELGEHVEEERKYYGWKAEEERNIMKKVELGKSRLLVKKATAQETVPEIWNSQKAQKSD